MSLGRSVEVVVDASKPLLDGGRKVEGSSPRWFGGEVSGGWSTGRRVVVIVANDDSDDDDGDDDKKDDNADMMLISVMNNGDG